MVNLHIVNVYTSINNLPYRFYKINITEYDNLFDLIAKLRKMDKILMSMRIRPVTCFVDMDNGIDQIDRLFSQTFSVDKDALPLVFTCKDLFGISDTITICFDISKMSSL